MLGYVLIITMFVKFILVDQKSLKKHKTPGTVHAASKKHETETRKNLTEHGKSAGWLAGTKQKLVETSVQVTKTGEQTENARKATRERGQAKSSESGWLELLATVAVAQAKLPEIRAEPQGEEVMMEVESIEPGSEVNYDNLILRPVYETFLPLSCRGFDRNTSDTVKVLCESYVPFRSSNTLRRDNTCPR